MPWLSILSGLLKLSAYVAQLIHTKKLMNAGAAKATLEGIQYAQTVTNNAIAAGHAASDDSVSDPFQEGPGSN